MFRRLRQAWHRRSDPSGAADADAAAGSPEGFPDRTERLEVTEASPPAADELILTVNGLRYRLNQLPGEIQQLVADLQKADELIALRRGTLDTLRTGRNRLRRQLGAGLAAQPPLADPSADTWSARLSPE